jgi:hypothetical protein
MESIAQRQSHVFPPTEDSAMRKSVRYLATVVTTHSKPIPIDLILKIATALLISFAATLVLVHAEVYFAGALIRS